MLATDVSPSRMAAARAAAATFIKGLPKGFKVGLVSFLDQADVVLPPTADHDAAVRALTRLQADNGTALGDAITRSVDLGLSSLNAKIAGKGTPLVVLLLSDGASTTGDQTPLEAAAAAKTKKVPVYMVALGTDEGRSRSPPPTASNASTASRPTPPRSRPSRRRRAASSSKPPTRSPSRACTAASAPRSEPRSRSTR